MWVSVGGEMPHYQTPEGGSYLITYSEDGDVIYVDELTSNLLYFKINAM